MYRLFTFFFKGNYKLSAKLHIEFLSLSLFLCKSYLLNFLFKKMRCSDIFFCNFNNLFNLEYVLDVDNEDGTPW